MILERLDEPLLGHGSCGPARGSALVDDPPRSLAKLLLSSQVLQVVPDHPMGYELSRSPSVVDNLALSMLLPVGQIPYLTAWLTTASSGILHRRLSTA